MQAFIERLLNEYVNVKNETFANNSFGVFVRNEIPEIIYETGLVNKENFLITGSVGQGNWAMIPWICIFNRSITTSATKGVYIVYLLSKDGNTLYLTFNQGCTDLKNKYGKKEAIRLMRENANSILEKIDNKGFRQYDSEMSLGENLTELGEMYEKGTILYKAYRKGNVPSEDILLKDLSNMMDIYNEYILNIKNNDIKSAFLKFLGPVNSLNGYQKSYKLVLYKVMFDLMDEDGVCSSEEISKAFRQFYVDRVNAGKVADVDVDKRIEFIKDSSAKDVYNVITANPFKVISDKGFMFKTNEPFEQEKIYFNIDLIKRLSDSDLQEIRKIIDKKLELYFKNIDMKFSLEKEFKLWMKWQPQRNSPASLYKQGTIDSMVSILKKGSIAFDSGDNTVSNCFEIVDVDGFKNFSLKHFSKAEQLDKSQGHSDYRNAIYFYQKFLAVKSIDGINYNKIETIIDSYEKNFELIFNGEKYKIEALEQYNKYWDINASDFAGMLEIAFSKSANLLSSGNYFAYKMLIEFAQAKPEEARTLFKKLYNETETIVKCANEFKSQTALYFEPLGKSTYQDLHAVSVYAFFMYPHKYCIYKSSFYDDFAKVIGYKPEKTNLDYNETRIKHNESLFEAIKYVLSTHSMSLLEKFSQKEQESNLDSISLNYWAFDLLHSIRYDILDTNDKEGEKMTTKQKIESIKDYIAAKGFNYEGNLIENFYLSLKSKPFVILAGTSGTGKTRLVKLFAEAIGAKMKLVPVRPDWSDSSDLFGHTDLSGKFQPGAIIDFIKQAEWDKETPYFLCLDEMNLARVEYYLSDFLSIIETRDRKDNGDIETDPMIDVDYYKDNDASKKYGRVFIPENLYIIGTVNMDETTFPFSKKVLDRANTIEFSFVNLMAKPGVNAVNLPRQLSENNSFLKTEYLYLSDCNNEDIVDSVCFELNEFNTVLLKANLHVGYRVRDEITFYMMNNKNSDLLKYETAFDNEIMQKILPRIQGSSRAIKDVLSELFFKCAGDYTGLNGATDFEQMQFYIDSGKYCKYPNSANKLKFMMRRYEEDGFTSYWL